MTFSSSANYFLSILNFLEERGASTCDALAAIGLDDFDLSVHGRGDQDNNQQRVSFDHYDQLLRYAESQLEQPLFGFDLGKDIKSADFGVLGYLIESSSNLTAAISSLLKYDQLVANIGHAEFVNEGKFSRIYWQPHQACSRQVILRNFTAWVAIARQLLGTGLAPAKVSLTNNWSLQEQEELSDWFACPITFGAKKNYIEFSSAYLKLNINSANPMLYASLEKLSEQQLAQFQQHNGLTERIQTLLISKVELFDCQIHDIAQLFHISVRQLQRKLKAEGTSFVKLVDQERQRRAQQLIGRESIGTIASKCGFSEQSSFNKAFARWYQCSPSEYIQRTKQSN
ncbi:AraC family transcriptional regulator [Endozoicomonas sp. G2_1]|uniref:AraC family transcriptional regulator n=1 Tax=Endozoicomonas sp. G2_1 TaxID=2821091 RepID=UPI001ADC7A89|nr:AraC family transcriptional regulator [Endozoicomonas sp. G2_1]MBO9489716.1 AraC family transcriptional regulator [Endozoicomonas sp. G2_1]